ncbi:MAG: NFACT family protein [Fusobacterium sp.]|nr:NFACT family protein [Fusobacterium sp.]
MITFDSLTMKAFIEENREFFTGSRIQKIQQPTRREVLFALRNNGETRKFYININPQFHHICFVTKETEARRFLEIPLKPPMFCMQLRKYLENAKIVKVNQPNHERIFEIYVETFNELQEKIELCLAIELMGKHSNIVLYNADTNIIIGCAHNVGSEKSREREMAGTLPYIYPPKQNKLDICDIQGEINEPLENFFFFSKAFAAQCKGQPVSKLKDFVELRGISPAITDDYSEFSLFSELLPAARTFSTVNEMIDEYFSYHIEKNKIKAITQELKTLINKKLSKHKKNETLMLEQLEREEKGFEYRLWGDLIMANLYNGKDFTPSIEVFDWEHDRNITIELDPLLTLKDNANKFYKRYNKSKKSIEKINEMFEENEIQINYYEQTLYALDSAQNYQELLDIKNEILPIFQGSKKTTPATELLEKEILGYKVFIGRNNKQNDFIVSKLSKDEDYWFHTHGCAGSHVLLKCAEPSDELIFECAKLAKEFSSAKLSSKVGVIYTQRKHLKKPPKAPLGYVIYKCEKEIIVTLS